MQKVALMSIIVIGVVAFGAAVIWNPYKDFCNFLRALLEFQGSVKKNAGAMLKKLAKCLVIPLLLFLTIALYLAALNKHKHFYVAAVAKAATCVEEGVLLFKCNFCDAAYEEAIPRIAHKYAETNRRASSCITEGMIVNTCEVCGESYATPMPLAAHTYAETERIDATCIKEGTVISVCGVCGDKKEEVIAKIDHKYEEISRIDATCTAQGMIQYACAYCGGKYDETLPIREHQWSQWYIAGESSKTEQDVKSRICFLCKETESTDWEGSDVNRQSGWENVWMSKEVLFWIIIAAVLAIGMIVFFKNKKGVLGAVTLIALGAVGFWGIKPILEKNNGASTSQSNPYPLNVERMVYAEGNQPQPAAAKLVNVERAKATSKLSDEFAIPCSFDGNWDTCWQDGDKGDGTGEILTYYFDKPSYVGAIGIVNGRVLNEINYKENCRIKDMKMYYFLDGQEMGCISVSLGDKYKEWEYCRLPDGVSEQQYRCDEIRIVIQSVYEGTVYNDLCLTEICFYEGLNK